MQFRILRASNLTAWNRSTNEPLNPLPELATVHRVVVDDDDPVCGCAVFTVDLYCIHDLTRLMFAAGRITVDPHDDQFLTWQVATEFPVIVIRDCHLG